MGAAFIRRQRMDLVHDHCAGGRQHFASRGARRQDIKRFRRRHQNMRRTAFHFFPLRLRRITAAHPGANVDIGIMQTLELRANSGKRCDEIFLDVVGQRLQRRDVDQLYFVAEFSRHALAHQGIDGRKKCRQGLTGTGRGRNKNMAPSQDCRPCVALCRRWFGESLVEPRGDRGMKCLQWHERLKSL